jgi:hypothetical protein
MKFSRLVLIVTSIAAFSSCSSSDVATTSTSTTTAATTTTASIPDCSQYALDAAAGERDSYVLGCASNWAAIQPESWICGEHCYAFIYKWDQGKWNLTMKCDQYSALSPDGYCQGMTGEISEGNYTPTISEYPPSDVACQIWAKSPFAEFEKNTQCA